MRPDADVEWSLPAQERVVAVPFAVQRVPTVTGCRRRPCLPRVPFAYGLAYLSSGGCTVALQVALQDCNVASRPPHNHQPVHPYPRNSRTSGGLAASIQGQARLQSLTLGWWSFRFSAPGSWSLVP
jgi:hypothetical protein